MGGGVLDRSNVLPKSLVTVYREEWIEDESASLDVIDAGVFFNATTEFVPVGRERPLTSMELSKFPRYKPTAMSQSSHSLRPLPTMIFAPSKVTARPVISSACSINVTSCRPLCEFQTLTTPLCEPVTSRPSGRYAISGCVHHYP